MRSIVWIMLLVPLLGHGRDWYVNNRDGSDGNDGSEQKPFRTAQAAVNRAQPGDTIHLLPAKALYRQQISIRGKTNIVIMGNGVTLTGADPLPETGWEKVGEGLNRRKLKRTMFDRHLLIRDGKEWSP